MKRSAVLVLSLWLAACGPSQAELNATLAAAEVYAVSTFAAQLTKAAEQNPSPTPTATQKASAMPPATEVQVTVTMEPSSNATQDACNVMVFREDITIADSEEVEGGATFTKTWSVENAGTCNWSPAYQLLFSHGDRMDGARTTQLQHSILAGAVDNISILLRAPTAPGEYTGWWTLATPSGDGFGHLSVVIIVP